jgi:hypothetical protein
MLTPQPRSAALVAVRQIRALGSEKQRGRRACPWMPGSPLWSSSRSRCASSSTSGALDGSMSQRVRQCRLCDLEEREVRIMIGSSFTPRPTASTAVVGLLLMYAPKRRGHRARRRPTTVIARDAASGPRAILAAGKHVATTHCLSASRFRIHISPLACFLDCGSLLTSPRL